MTSRQALGIIVAITIYALIGGGIGFAKVSWYAARCPNDSVEASSYVGGLFLGMIVGVPIELMIQIGNGYTRLVNPDLKLRQIRCEK